MVSSGNRCRPLVLLAASAMVAAGIPAAAQEETAPVGGVRVDRVLSAVLTITSDGRTDLSDFSGFERRSAPNGDVLSELHLEPDGEAPLQPLGDFRCAGQGKSGSGFTDHTTGRGPARLEVDAWGGGIRSAFWAYSLNPARLVGENRRPTRQVAVCLAGGAMAADGWKLLQAGAGAAYEDLEYSYKLGMGWPNGTTPAEATGGAQLGSPTKAGVVGRITQEPEDRLNGSYIGPAYSEFDEYFENGVAGWWQDLCLDDSACTAADGSEQFHGNIAYGVWEFLPDEIPADGLRFRLASYATLLCIPGAEGCVEDQQIA